MSVLFAVGPVKRANRFQDQINQIAGIQPFPQIHGDKGVLRRWGVEHLVPKEFGVGWGSSGHKCQVCCIGVSPFVEVELVTMEKSLNSLSFLKFSTRAANAPGKSTGVCWLGMFPAHSHCPLPA